MYLIFSWDLVSGSTCSTPTVAKHNSYQFWTSKRVPHSEKPAFTQLQLWRGIFSTTLPPLLMGGASKWEQRKSATTDFFSTSLKLFLRYDIFFKAKGKHSCSSAPILIGSFKNPLVVKFPPTLYFWFKHTWENKTTEVLKFQAYSKNLLDLEWLPLTQLLSKPCSIMAYFLI